MYTSLSFKTIYKMPDNYHSAASNIQNVKQLKPYIMILAQRNMNKCYFSMNLET